MNHKLFAHILAVLLLHLQLFRAHAAPSSSNSISNDIDYNDSKGVDGAGRGAMGNLFRDPNNSQMDYNMLFAHVKEFFMYLPVMMATLRESMIGFPKFAEGIRILTSKSGRAEGWTDSGERRRDLWD